VSGSMGLAMKGWWIECRGIWVILVQAGSVVPSAGYAKDSVVGAHWLG